MPAPNATSSPLLIKPFSSTPAHLRTLQLSFIDQLPRPMYIHLIFFFEPFHHLPQISDNLTRSLSDVLAVYYPLAGRFQQDLSIDCNDAGAEYTEMWFHGSRVMDVVENSGPDEVKQYVPVKPCGGIEVPLAVQVNFFGCGGIAIGVCVSHGVADATSMGMFANAWAAACRGDDKMLADTRPTFGSAHRFPPKDFSRFFPSGEFPTPQLSSPPKLASKRFLFDNTHISALRKAASGPLVENPTKVEAVSAFLWRHFIEAKGRNTNLAFAATHGVDIRHRANPPLPHSYFGNAIGRAFTMMEIEPADYNYYNLALLIRSAIRGTGSSYVKMLENGDKFLEYYSQNEENDPIFKEGRKSLEACDFTSWSRLPAYEVDFGWGKPVWVSTICYPVKNFIVFLGTRTGDGIEAWVNMGDEEIGVIERNYNLLLQVVELK